MRLFMVRKMHPCISDSRGSLPPAVNEKSGGWGMLIMPSRKPTSATGVSPVQARAFACGYKK
jgi:hypothetical protein